MKHSKIVAIAAIVFFALSCKSAQKDKGTGTSSPEGTKIIKEYWDDKSLKGQGPARGKEKQGAWTLYHKTSGEKLGEGEYLNNKQHGMWTFYYKNGQKSTASSLSISLRRIMSIMPASARPVYTGPTRMPSWVASMRTASRSASPTTA